MFRKLMGALGFVAAVSGAPNANAAEKIQASGATTTENIKSDGAKLNAREQIKHDLVRVKSPDKIIYSSKYSLEEKANIATLLNVKYRELDAWYELANTEGVSPEIKKSAGNNFAANVEKYLKAIEAAEAGTLKP